MWRGWYGNKCLILLLLFLLKLNAQQHFNVIHQPGNNEPNIIVTDTGYVVLQQGNPPFDFLDLKYFDQGGGFLKTDSIGLKAFYEDCRNCLQEYEEGYLKVGTYFYADGTNEIVLVRFNESLDTLQTAQFSYSDLKDSDAFGLKVFDENEIIVVGNHYRYSTSTFSLLITRLDSNLNVVWDTVYSRIGGPQVGGYRGIDVEKTADGGYLIGGIATRFLNLPNYGLLLKTDSLGGEEWRKELTGPEGNNEVLLHPINDSVFSFITTQGQYPAFSGTPYNRLRLGKITQDGTILMDTLIGPDILSMSTAFFEPTKDGYYVTAGYAQNLNWGSYAMKFSEEGDSIWFRQYFHGSEHFVDKAFIESMAHTPDSGFIFCGYFMDLGPGGRGAHTWLVKTDKYGCDTAGCHTVGLVKHNMPNANFSVYPNPFEDELVIKWNGQNLHEPLNLRLTDSQRKVLIDQKIEDYQKYTYLLSVKNLNPGLYILEIHHKEERIHVERLVRQ